MLTKWVQARAKISIAKTRLNITKYWGMFIGAITNFKGNSIKLSTTIKTPNPIPNIAKIVKPTLWIWRKFMYTKVRHEQAMYKRIGNNILVTFVGKIVFNFSTNFNIFIWHSPMIKYRIKIDTILALDLQM